MRKLLAQKAVWFSILVGVAAAWALALVLEPRPRLEMSIDSITQTMHAMSHDRRFLAMANDDASEFEVWDVTKGRIHQTLRLDRRAGTHRPPIQCRSLNPGYRSFAHDNKSFAILGGGEIFVWDVDSGDLKSTHRLPNWEGNEVLNFDRSGRLVLAMPSETEVKLWDVTEQRVFKTLERLPHPERARPLLLIQLDHAGYLTNWEKDETVKGWDLASGELVFHLPAKNFLSGHLSAYDGKLMKQAPTGECRILDLRTGNERTFTPPPRATLGLVDLSPDATRLTWTEWVSDAPPHPIVKWLTGLLPRRPRATEVTHVLDLTTGKELGTVPGSGFLCGTQPLLMVSDNEYRVFVYDLPIPSRWPRIVGYACLVACVPYLISLLFAWRRRKRVSLVS